LEGSVAGVGEGAEVLLGGGDLFVAEAFHDDLQVGSSGEEPGSVGGAEVVELDAAVEPAGVQGGDPDASAEGVAGPAGPGAGGEQQVFGAQAEALRVGEDEVWSVPVFVESGLCCL
jgi:hypothetical protein